jgi:hypothetical protein
MSAKPFGAGNMAKEIRAILVVKIQEKPTATSLKTLVVEQRRLRFLH